MDNRSVLPGYFEAAGLRLLAGRFPTDRDLTAASRVAVMSESAARHVFGASDPIGRRLEIDVGRSLIFDVIGVVADVRRSGPRRPAEPELYPVFREGDPLAMPNTIVARPAGSAGDLAIALRTAVQSIGLRVRAPAISIGDRNFVTSIAHDRQRTWLLGIAGALGLMLALVGIVATTAYAVARRRQELGVRMAMGAARGEVVWEIVRDTAWPMAIGLALGLGGALLSTRAIASFLFETTPNDPLALGAAVAVLGLAGLVAAWIPARRAALIDPVATLRSE
jgi:ABC-type antimicrobial peptide transport system permease subunit